MRLRSWRNNREFAWIEELGEDHALGTLAAGIKNVSRLARQKAAKQRDQDEMIAAQKFWAVWCCRQSARRLGAVAAIRCKTLKTRA